MNLDQLKYFLEIARHEHLGKAARRLRLSPSTLSYSIECLERDLDVKLFEKRGKNIFLTNEGKKLATSAPAVFAKIDEVRAQMNAEELDEEKYYTFAGTHGLANGLLVPALKQSLLEKKHQFEVLSLRSSQVIRGVIDKKIDFGICYSPQAHPEVKQEVVAKGELKIYVSKKHPLAKSKFSSDALNKYPASLPLRFEGIEMCESHPMFEKFSIKPEVKLGYDNYEVAVSTCHNSLAWSLLPDHLESKFKSQLVSIPHPRGWKAPYTITAVWHIKRNLDRVKETLLNNLKKA